MATNLAEKAQKANFPIDVVQRLCKAIEEKRVFVIASDNRNKGEVIDTSLESALRFCKEKQLNPDNCARLEVRYIFGAVAWSANPLSIPPTENAMFGGNYCKTSDSRFPKYNPNGFATPIAIHDRLETEEEYRALSI